MTPITITLTVNAAQLRVLTRAAAARGVPPETLLSEPVTGLLDQLLRDDATQWPVLLADAFKKANPQERTDVLTRLQEWADR